MCKQGRLAEFGMATETPSTLTRVSVRCEGGMNPIREVSLTGHVAVLAAGRRAVMERQLAGRDDTLPLRDIRNNQQTTNGQGEYGGGGDASSSQHAAYRSTGCELLAATTVGQGPFLAPTSIATPDSRLLTRRALGRHLAARAVG
jgi:hypothetical protein